MLFYVRKHADEDGSYPIFVEGPSDVFASMVEISSVMRIDEDQVKASIWAATGRPENSIRFHRDTGDFEIYRVR